MEFVGKLLVQRLIVQAPERSSSSCSQGAKNGMGSAAPPNLDAIGCVVCAHHCAKLECRGAAFGRGRLAWPVLYQRLTKQQQITTGADNRMNKRSCFSPSAAKHKFQVQTKNRERAESVYIMRCDEQKW